MAGELARVAPAEIGDYANAAKEMGINSLHFYTAEESIGPSVWDAVARA